MMSPCGCVCAMSGLDTMQAPEALPCWPADALPRGNRPRFRLACLAMQPATGDRCYTLAPTLAPIARVHAPMSSGRPLGGRPIPLDRAQGMGTLAHSHRVNRLPVHAV